MSFNPAVAMGSSFGGSRSVLVRGFDFGTSEEQIVRHMSMVGTVGSCQWLDDGSVCVIYSSAEEAKAALDLQQTNIPGNRRYLDVLIMDPKEFLAGHSIDMDKAQQFYALTSAQQQAVIAKGSLSTARDPTAVLVQRMQQAKGVGKGSYGPAKGCGAAMKGGMGSGPYGGGGMGKGGSDNMGMMMEQMKGIGKGGGDDMAMMMMMAMMKGMMMGMGGGNW